MRRRTEAQVSRSESDNVSKTTTTTNSRASTSSPEQDRISCSSVLLNTAKCLLFVIVVPPFLNYASLQREGQMLLPKGGQMIDVGLGQKMHLLCKGQGKPVIILDAPTGMPSDIWLHVQDDLSTLTKVCAYDRMGLGFSKRLMQNESTGTEKVWGLSTTGRMVDDLHRLLAAAELAKPFILVGSELGALNSRFYSHIHDAQVTDLVMIDPIPEGIFDRDPWKQYWFGSLLPSLQAKQFSAATGLTRLLIILGAIEPPIMGENISEEVIQRQKFLMCNPAHQSGAVDEHYFLNESAAQVRDISKFKPLTSRTSISIITGDSFDLDIPEELNQMVTTLQRTFLRESYPSANHIHIKGADRRMIYRKPSAVVQHLRRLVHQRQANQRSH